MTRTSSRTIDPVSCRTTQEIVEPGRADLQVTTDISYDAYGNVAYSTSTAAGQALRMTSYSWPSSGRFLQSVTNAEGHRTSMAWDSVQAVRTSETDPNGLVTQWQYDAFQRPVRELRPDGTRTELARAYCGSSCGTPTALHSVTSTEQGAGGIADPQLDRCLRPHGSGGVPAGRAARRHGDAHHCLLGPRSADPAERAVLVLRPAGFVDHSHLRPARPTVCAPSARRAARTRRRSQRSGATAGLSVSQTDALGRVTVSRRDVRGNVVQAVDAGNADTDYEYDAFGDLVRVRDFRGNETVMTYDPRGRRSSISDVDAGLRTFQYTPFGELKSETNARGQTATFAYDRISRMVDRQELEGHDDVDVGAVSSGSQRRCAAERVRARVSRRRMPTTSLAVRRRTRVRIRWLVRHAVRLRHDRRSPRHDYLPVRTPALRRCVCGTTMTAADWFAFPMPTTRTPRSGRPTHWTRLVQSPRRRSATVSAWTATGTPLRRRLHARTAGPGRRQLLPGPALHVGRGRQPVVAAGGQPRSERGLQLRQSRSAGLHDQFRAAPSSTWPTTRSATSPTSRTSAHMPTTRRRSTPSSPRVRTAMRTTRTAPW